MLQRYKNSADWTADNPVLLIGELGIESDTNKAKVGDGTTTWNNLPYCVDGTISSFTFQNIIDVNGRLDARLQYEVLNG